MGNLYCNKCGKEDFTGVRECFAIGCPMVNAILVQPATTKKDHKLEDLELLFAEKIAKKHGFILVPKKEIEQLIIALEALL